MSNLKLRCQQCLGEDFELRDGFYFCSECGIQVENLVEMEHEEHNENLQSQHRIKFASDKKKQKDNLKARRLTSWEEYNFMLIGLVNEILEIQNIPNFKVTCLQLWISYLRATEAAFFSKETVAAPKLFAAYRQADAEILYNKKPKEKKRSAAVKKEKVETSGDEGARQRQKQMRKSEKIISQELNESAKSESFNTSILANLSLDSIISEHENVELEIEWSAAGEATRAKKSKGKERVGVVQLTRREKAHVLSGSTLLHIIYCALNICGSDLQLSDLIRLVREGHLSYFNLRRFLPDDITEQDVPLSFQEVHSYRMINHTQVHNLLSYFIRLIPDLAGSFRTPSISSLARRFVDDMNLPRELGDFVERLTNFLPPEMRFRVHMPNYEGRAMAYVLFVLKLLFGIDGYREKEMSESARTINRKCQLLQPIFVYEDWRKFIEYRQVILGKFYYPAMIFQSEVAADRPYMAFNAMLDALNPKTRNLERQMVDAYNQKRMQSKKNAAEMLSGLVKTHEDHAPQFSFSASLTPHKDNFQHIRTEVEVNRKIADVDYSSHSLEVFLSPQKFAAREDIELQTRKSTFPKCFAFGKPAVSCKFTSKEIFKMENKAEKVWTEEVKERHEANVEIEAEVDEDFHRKQMDRVLAKRRMWRQMRKNMATADDLEDSKVFSDSEDEPEVDSDEDEINCSEDPELCEQPQLTLVVPDFNMWQRAFPMKFMMQARNEAELAKLPVNFRWLLNLAASMLHQHPVHVYWQLLCIENQFMHVYQPIELMRNVMLLQSKSKQSRVYGMKMNPSMDEDW